MGLGGISLAQLAILLLIVFSIFGTRKLRGLGEDLGKSIKSFRDAMSDTQNQSEELNKHTLSDATQKSSQE